MKLTGFNEKKNRMQWAIVFLTVLTALILRLTGIDWGMPHGNLHPDEGIIYEQAYQNALDHSFEVREYYRPNHVTIKLNTLLYLGIQALYFSPRGENDFSLNFHENLGIFITSSRILTVLFGVGIVILAYCIGLYWDERRGLFAAILFAIFPSFIEHAHYITPDIPLLFFLTCVLWAALHYQRKPSMTWLFWMAFFTALATCEKYPGLYGCVIIAVAVISTNGKKISAIIRHGVMAVIFVLLGIMAISPVLLIDGRTVLTVMAGQNKQYHIGADGLNFAETLVYYLKTTWTGIGFVLTACGAYGMVNAFRKNVKATILLITFGAYLIPISVLKVHWERYTLPIYATGLFFGAFGAFDLAELLCKRMKRKAIAKWIAGLAFFCLPAVSLLSGAAAVCGRFLAPDSRIVLQDVFTEMGVTQDNTQYDCNTPLDPGGFYGAFTNFEDGDPDEFKYGNGPRFIMTSSAQRDLYLEADPEVYGGVAKFYERLDERYPLVYSYKAEMPNSYFWELQNIWFSMKSIRRYARGVASGYEIRLYQRLP